MNTGSWSHWAERAVFEAGQVVRRGSGSGSGSNADARDDEHLCDGFAQLLKKRGAKHQLQQEGRVVK